MYSKQLLGFCRHGMLIKGKPSYFHAVRARPVQKIKISYLFSTSLALFHLPWGFLSAECLFALLLTLPLGHEHFLWKYGKWYFPLSPLPLPSFLFHVSGIGLCDLKVVGHWPQRKELFLGKELKAAKFNSHFASTMLEILYQHEDHTTMEKY